MGIFYPLWSKDKTFNRGIHHSSVLSTLCISNIKYKPMKRTKKDTNILEGWRDDNRMVYLSSPGRDLSPKELLKWERNIRKHQIRLP